MGYVGSLICSETKKKPKGTKLGAKRFQAQNKERREEAKGKELSALKKENGQLRRQVARLTKQLTKTIELHIGKEDIAQAETVVKIPDTSIKCEECSSKNIKVVQLPTGNLRACKQCGWRKKYDS
jgi:hypothetical protein